MKNNGNFKVLNMTPKILISHYDLEAIKHIVAIAPQEAQWFHRVERIEKTNNIYYRIYEMYIPEQYTSAAQVESDPHMMVKFYKEIREEHGQDKANEVMQNLTAWCHSHHNMGVGPSGQDVKQFAEQIKNAHDANVDLPQIMLIFNKKDTFYSKIYDPKLGLVFENVQIVVQGYDFSEIDNQAKTKFKKRVLPTKGKSWKTKSSTSYTSPSISWGWDRDDTYSFSTSSEQELLFADLIDDYLESNKNYQSSISSVFRNYNPKKKSQRNFVDKLAKEFNLIGFSAFAELLSFDPNTIANIPSTLDWIVERKDMPGAHEDLLNDLESSDFDEELLKCAYVTAKNIEKEIQESADNDTGVIDLDPVVESFLEIIESIYQEELSEDTSTNRFLDWNDINNKTDLI